MKPENNAFTVSIYLAVVNVGASLSPFLVNSVSGLFGAGIAARYCVSGAVILCCMALSILANRWHEKVCGSRRTGK